MNDLGRKPPKLYDTMPQEPDTIYPTGYIPQEVFAEERYPVGHKCIVEVMVEITSADKMGYGVKYLQSEKIESIEEEQSEDAKQY